MKKTLSVLLFLLCYLVNAQNIEDAYKNRNESPELFPNELGNYNGEYQIFLDRLFWSRTPHLSSSAISLSLEIVSFPFLPEDMDNMYQNPDRVLTTTQTNPNTYEPELILSYQSTTLNSGRGWEIGDYKIFLKTDNIKECIEGVSPEGYECEGEYGLITQGYYKEVSTDPNPQSRVLLPHTVIKHTLYFHCGPNLGDQIIDSVSWLYDNTRGRMKEYPFTGSTMKDKFAVLNTDIIDVSFRPTIHEYDPGIQPDIPYPPAEWLSNVSYYDSGWKDEIGNSNNTGSVNYFPQEEVRNPNICQNYLLYWDGVGLSGSLKSIHNNNFGNGEYSSDYVHPPPFVLLDAPLLNVTGNHYAGYKDGGFKMNGIEHVYKVNDPFDMRIINPSEKIFYNPSYVEVNCDLTFPCGYQFITLRGKYADRLGEVHNPSNDFSSQYWDNIPYFEFEYDRDYPIPVNPDPEVNSQPLSVYKLDEGVTITIEPYVILMDLYFAGTSSTNKSIIRYVPELTYGNWDYDPNKVILIPVTNYGTDCQLYIPKDTNWKSEQVSEIIEEDLSVLKVLNSGTHYPIVQVEINPTTQSVARIYDCFGSILIEEIINSPKQSINCSGLKRGVYIATVHSGKELLQTQNFSKR